MFTKRWFLEVRGHRGYWIWYSSIELLLASYSNSCGFSHPEILIENRTFFPTPRVGYMVPTLGGSDRIRISLRSFALVSWWSVQSVFTARRNVCALDLYIYICYGLVYVCPSVTSRCPMKTAKHMPIVMQTARHG